MSQRLLRRGSAAAERLLAAGRCSCVADTSGGDADGEGNEGLEDWGSSSTCGSAAGSGGDSGSGAISCVTLDCNSLEAVESLLTCLAAAEVSVWL